MRPTLSEKKINNLTLRTEQALRQRIVDGPLKVGEKLPTEKALAVEFGVSRTVIREAVAALRADGLLEAKHGVGYFVSNQPSSVEPQVMGAMFESASMLDTLELRMAVEIHAAGLAAARRSWAQEAKIWQAADAFAELLAKGEPTETADWTFHRSISEATNNSAFLEFFDRLGLAILPRRTLAGTKERGLITPSYLHKSIAEHKAICQAISDGDIEGARAAVRAHLGKSQMLYRGLAMGDRSPEEADGLDAESA